LTLTSTVTRVSTAGYSAFGSDDFVQARSCPVLRLATWSGSRSRCVQSMSATQHSNQRVPVLACSRFIVIRTHIRSVHSKGWAHRNRGIGRFTTSKTLQRIARGSWGVFHPNHEEASLLCSLFGDQPLTPLSRPLLRLVHVIFPRSNAVHDTARPARPFLLREPRRALSFHDPRCLPSTRDPRLRMTI